MKRITEILENNKKSMSFEVFPPKKEISFDNVRTATEEIAKIGPAFMSVTYGAGGGTSRYTLDIAKNIESNFDFPVITHLTCVSSSRETIDERLKNLKENGIANVMALRGDLTPELMDSDRNKWDFKYAADLVKLIREEGYDFCIGGGCYPEKHPESPSIEEDILHLKEKTDAGCNFLTTQMFFNNDFYYDFVDRCRHAGINAPILPGIMPMTKSVQVKRSAEISGSFIPKVLTEYAEKYKDDNDSMKKAGIEFALRQIEDLYANGVTNAHVYTMNYPDVAEQIYKEFF